MAKKNTGNNKYEAEYTDDLIPEKKAEKVNTAKAKNDKSGEGDKNSLAIKITALSLAALTVVMLVLGIVLAIVNRKVELDYMADDLSKYVVLDKSDYVGFPAEIDIPAYTELDVKHEIIKLLYANRETPEGDLPYQKNVTISAGDKVSMFYRGYTIDENGKKNYFDGGCNFNSTSPSELEIGSGQFIPGFEVNLIGKNQNDHATMQKIDEGFVKTDDVILLTYSVYRGDGTTETSKSAIVDLSDPDLDTKWGGGFAKYWSENKVEIGKTIEKLNVTSIKDAAKEDLYNNLKVTEVYRVNKVSLTDPKDILEVEAVFPYNYNTAELQGKKAIFETYILAVQDYTAPEFNDEFITAKLKLTADDLADYTGTNLAEKYKDKITKDLEDKRQDAITNAVATIFWKHILEVAEFKKLPRGDVETYYNSLYSQITAAYPSYQNSYSTLDAFARAYLGIDSKADWEAQILKDAEQSVKQKLAFYYIIREEGFIPTDAEYQALKTELYDAEVKAYLDYLKVSEDDENYADRLQDAKNYIDLYYDDQYWDVQIQHEYGIEKICALANVTNKSKSE